MALAQIIDLEERRRARVTPPSPAPAQQPVFYLMWMPVYFWIIA